MPAIRSCCVALGLLVALAIPTTSAHHVSGHHGAEVVECDCPTGVELASPAWVRLLPPTQPNTVAYMVLRNLTDADIHIVAAESPVARAAELHEHQQDAAGVMRMRQVEAIVIPARGEVELKPGGLHLMLIDLIEPLQEGQAVPLTLYVEGFRDLHIHGTVQRAKIGTGHHHEHNH